MHQMGNIQQNQALAQGLHDKYKDKCDFHLIWKLKIPNKQKTSLWNVCVDGLPTKQRLNKSKVCVPQNCVACDCNREDSNHRFLQCPTFKRV